MTDKTQRAQHWNAVYGLRTSERFSWFQDVPAASLELIDAAGAAPGT